MKGAGSAVERGVDDALHRPDIDLWRAGRLFQGGKDGLILVPGRYPSYEESTGQTLAAEESVVGMALDSHAGLKRGPELVTNGTFDTDISGWAEGVTASAVWDNGTIEVTGDGTTGRESYQQELALDPNTFYEINIEVVSEVGGAFAFIADQALSSTTGRITLLNGAAVGTYSQIIETGSDSSHIHIGTGSGGTVKFDNISVRKLPGHHPTQATTGFKPKLKQTAGGVWYFNGDGSDDYIINTDGPVLTQPYAISFVTRRVGTGDQQFLYSGQSPDVSIEYASSVVAMNAGTLLSGDDITQNEFSIITAIFGGANSELYQNGVLAASGNAGTNNMTGISLFAKYDGTLAGEVDIAPVVAMNFEPTVTQRKNNERWLANISGVSL